MISDTVNAHRYSVYDHSAILRKLRVMIFSFETCHWSQNGSRKDAPSEIPENNRVLEIQVSKPASIRYNQTEDRIPNPTAKSTCRAFAQKGGKVILICAASTPYMIASRRNNAILRNSSSQLLWPVWIQMILKIVGTIRKIKAEKTKALL